MAHILIVDDRLLNREFLATLLGYYGHTLAEAVDGVEALARVRERRPDLVITDLLMPNMDGEEFTRRLRADPATKDMPVIIYTATYRVREARAIADRAGVRQVLAKPSEPKVIVAAVAEALGESAPAPGKSGVPQPKDVVEQFKTVQTLNLSLGQVLDDAMHIAAEQAKSMIAVRALEDALHNVQSLGLRFTGLVELGLNLSRAREPRELIELFCRALQDILSAHYAGVVVLGSEGEPPRQFAACGLDDATCARVADEIADCPAAKRILAQDGAGRMVIGVKPTDVIGLPASHPPVKNFLACPVAAHDKTIGWTYVADRLGDESFSTDDERITMALAAQFATAWDSLGLYTELERLVAQRTRQLVLSNRELEAFSYSVSHDLRAPLRAIGGFASILRLDHATSLAPEAVKLLERVEENVKRMGTLINDLLEYSHAGRAEVAQKIFNLGHLVRECLEELKPELQGRQVEITVGDFPRCYGDSVLLKQALLNLLANAFKYTRKKADARIEIGAETRGGEHIVHVRDNGVGFDMNYAGKLFEVFQRLHGSEFEGTGIGLAIVQRVIQRHGGRVWAEGEVDKGATFFLSLPDLPALCGKS